MKQAAQRKYSSGAWSTGPLAVLAALLWCGEGTAAPILSEIGTGDRRSPVDELGNHPDWIEIYNPGPGPVDLKDWYLTDDAEQLARWRFPAVQIDAAGFLIVFASGRGRRDPGQPLHTSFKLERSGEFLALVEPDGTSVASQLGPRAQGLPSGASYGLVNTPVDHKVVFVEERAPARAFVPVNAALATAWTAPEFNDAGWKKGPLGAGFESETGFQKWIGLDLRERMRHRSSSAYIRVPFDARCASELIALTLEMRYDDGFVAYLNGAPVASDNGPEKLSFDATAARSREDRSVSRFVSVDLTRHRSRLHKGRNVLAIHGLNQSVGSSDFLIAPRLTGVCRSPKAPSIRPGRHRYFTQPTPGGFNGIVPVDRGPVIVDITPAGPGTLSGKEALTISARFESTLHPIKTRSLLYRVMFGAEVSTPMSDDGKLGDAVAGDGVFSARIPSSALKPGDLVRYRIAAVDSAGNPGRWPLWADPDNAPRYVGATIEEADLSTRLPVLRWFLEDPDQADTEVGARSTVAFLGTVYDNIYTRTRGGTLQALPRKSYKFDFNPGSHFRYQADQPLVSEFNLNSTYTDKAYIRPLLSFQTYRDAGIPAPVAFPIHLRKNGRFAGIYLFIEQVDDDFLRRNGLDPKGALYKFVSQNALEAAHRGVQKKSRRWEDHSDLERLIAGLELPPPQRTAFIMDHVNVPALINYLAVTNLINDYDHERKNFYAYRDSDGTGEWRLLPWDKDLTFGKVWSGENGVLEERVNFTALTSGDDHRLLSNMLQLEPFRSMYYRRLRTLMDRFLQPPATPRAERYFERMLDAHQVLLRQDALEDYKLFAAPWKYGADVRFDQALRLLEAEFLMKRRFWLYDRSPKGAGPMIPSAQSASPRIDFGKIVQQGQDRAGSAEYVELSNPSLEAVDLSGWRLTGPVQMELEPGTVLPGGGVLTVTSDVKGFRARRSGQFVRGDYSGSVAQEGWPLELRDGSGRIVASGPRIPPQ